MAAIGDQRQQRLGQEEHALEVDVHQPVEVGFRRLRERHVDADAGIVDEVVELRAVPPGRSACLRSTAKAAKPAVVPVSSWNITALRPSASMAATLASASALLL